MAPSSSQICMRVQARHQDCDKCGMSALRRQALLRPTLRPFEHQIRPCDLATHTLPTLPATDLACDRPCDADLANLACDRPCLRPTLRRKPCNLATLRRTPCGRQTAPKSPTYTIVALIVAQLGYANLATLRLTNGAFCRRGHGPANLP